MLIGPTISLSDTSTFWSLTRRIFRLIWWSCDSCENTAALQGKTFYSLKATGCIKAHLTNTYSIKTVSLHLDKFMYGGRQDSLLSLITQYICLLLVCTCKHCFYIKFLYVLYAPKLTCNLYLDILSGLAKHMLIWVQMHIEKNRIRMRSDRPDHF